ncbi:glutamine-hydrolyzing GMP synthase [Ruminococcus sp.]|uniref:glutamine-hydrolyzing GMP synthase n=1 Tax=Ruminococcus sp. TaxID=41978 RepID=UPI002608A247|nr:glutamine-hydrolyzing GMP synthase [Ruminococcus sp.]MDD6990069.1 glutamine-hydrolyzing GMP synthase [Ruminococcus sp.]MDY6202025.1 glutamine-hydrolyzing GMP synthase [Ruminococcus sp.]
MSNKETVIVLDFGGQYNQLIARRVRECNVYCEILPYTVDIQKIKDIAPKGIIFTGGPNSVYDETSPHYTPEIFKLGIPILGICYGCQLMAYSLGGVVTPATDNSSSEYGKTETQYNTDDVLFKGLHESGISWMSHRDYISEVPEGFSVTATTAVCPTAAMSCPDKKLYGVQFHPEVNHTENGKSMLKSFLYDVCECKGEWKMESFIDTTVAQLKEQIGDKGVVLGLSGGVDSSVAAALLSKAVGKQLTCVFVDQGLMRKDEGDFVEETFTKLFDMNFVRINCQDEFLSKLKGVVDPEKKREIIGTEFYKVFWGKIRESYGSGFFAQGTIYPDRIESGKGDAAKIKTHHNQVGIPEDIKFESVIEPLKDLFKDEVREVGEKLGIPHQLVWRQPFPGPGLGVRVIGEVTAEKVHILQEADAILRDEMDKCGYSEQMSQFFAVLPGVKTVGVMGDARTYDELVAIRAVTTDDFMTADWAKIPYEILGRVSNRIINEVEHVNRVVYDITSKPPGTVEWE